jgi:hypothetical protein
VEVHLASASHDPDGHRNRTADTVARPALLDLPRRAAFRRDRPFHPHFAVAPGKLLGQMRIWLVPGTQEEQSSKMEIHEVHKTALEHGRLFFESYLGTQKTLQSSTSAPWSSTVRYDRLLQKNASTSAFDFEHGKGVDVLLTDPYRLPFEENSVDIAVSSSCYEHSEFFWLSFLTP